jgi:hypothetical protein
MFDAFSIAAADEIPDVGFPMVQATLRGDTFGIGATEGTVGADAAAMVMLTLFLVLLTLILLVARGLAKRAANPLPEQALLEDIQPNSAERTIHRDAAKEGIDENFPDERDRHSKRDADPWEKPEDWWRKISH